MAQCCLCGGQLILLGQLGRTKQFRCRQCGMIFSAVRRARRNQSEDKAKNSNGEQTQDENQNAATRGVH